MIICADDFGYTADINQAVIELVRCRRITAVSCMMGAEATDATILRELAGLTPAVDIGLHLAFTADVRPLNPTIALSSLVGADGGFHPFVSLLRGCLCGCINPTEVARETQAQYEKFVACVGRPPDFVDGHMHVHQFPGVCEGVFLCLKEIEPAKRPYVRNTAITFSRSIKQGVSTLKTLSIGWFGKAFRQMAEAAKFPTNSEFGGVYDYNQYRSFPDFLRQFAEVMDKENDLLMVHPGLHEPWRRTEYETLLDADWLRPHLNRFRKTPHQAVDSPWWSVGGG